MMQDTQLILQLQQRVRELRATATFMIEEATNIEKDLVRLYESDNRPGSLTIPAGPILSDHETAKLSANTLKKLAKAIKR